jgi:hypothetical protein
MSVGPTELILVLVSLLRFVIPVLLIVGVVYLYLRLKDIEARVRSLEERNSAKTKE